MSINRKSFSLSVIFFALLCIATGLFCFSAATASAEEPDETTYTVTFMDDKRVIKTVELVSGQTLDNADLSDAEIERDGYTFQGWSLAKGGILIDLAETTVQSDMTIYAVYKFIPVTYSVAETADKIIPLGVCQSFFEYWVNISEYYVGTIHYVFIIDKLYLNENYNYGLLWARYDYFLKAEEMTSTETDYIKKFDEIGMPYQTDAYPGSEDMTAVNNGNSYENWLNLSFFKDEYYDEISSTLEERLNRELIVFMYVEDPSTGERAYTEPLIASYNSAAERSDRDAAYYKGLYNELLAENEQLKAEVKDSDTSVKNRNIVLGVVGVAVLIGIIAGFVSVLRPKKYKRK